jgi:hydroxymethylpyrimidine/phosphomethylpyrimidine kinase
LGEASVLAGFEVRDKPAMEQAARAIHALGARIVVVKGGHLADCADDLVYDGMEMRWLPAEHIDTPHTHGTGCTFSAAIAAFLAKGYAPLEAIARAKDYLTAALARRAAHRRGTQPRASLPRLLRLRRASKAVFVGARFEPRAPHSA